MKLRQLTTVGQCAAAFSGHKSDFYSSQRTQHQSSQPSKHSLKDGASLTKEPYHPARRVQLDVPLHASLYQSDQSRREVAARNQRESPNVCQSR